MEEDWTCEIYGSDNRLIGNVVYPTKIAEARLIAAAPDLYDALTDCFDLKEEMIVGSQEDALVLRVPMATIQKAAAALAKARGGK